MKIMPQVLCGGTEYTMAKRRTNRIDDYYDGYEDDPIGLTGAFETVNDPQSVQYDEGDQAIGLTQAFARVGMDEERDWQEEQKWKGFDWDNGWKPSEHDESVPESSAEQHSQKEENVAAESAQDKQVDETANTSAGSSEVAGARSVTSDASMSGAIWTAPHEINVEKDLANATQATSGKGGRRRGRHAAHAQELSPRMKRSHRTRKLLIALVVLLVLAGCALGYFAFRTLTHGQQEAAQHAQEEIAATKDSSEAEPQIDDSVKTAAQLADVPNLTKLFGKSSDAAIKELKRGAFISSNRKVKEKGSAIKTNLTVALADEPADSKTGTPSVYLGLDKDGKIIQVGYSASADALGFGSLSFADAVNGDHVIEKTLSKIGVDVKEGSAVLPKDRNKYVTYASDKTTIVKERCSFDGEVSINDKPCDWSAVLSYDYTTQVITGNLSDTVRIIYVYVTQK